MLLMGGDAMRLLTKFGPIINQALNSTSSLFQACPGDMLTHSLPMVRRQSHVHACHIMHDAQHLRYPC